MAVCVGDPVYSILPVLSSIRIGSKLPRQDSCKISTLSLVSKTTGIHTQDHECARLGGCEDLWIGWYVGVGTLHIRMKIKQITRGGWIWLDIILLC